MQGHYLNTVPMYSYTLLYAGVYCAYTLIPRKMYTFVSQNLTPINLTRKEAWYQACMQTIIITVTGDNIWSRPIRFGYLYSYNMESQFVVFHDVSRNYMQCSY